LIEITPIASGSTGNCYHITDGSSPILIDPGIQFKKIQKAIDFKVSGLAGALVSHEHMDHAKAVKDLIKAGVDCYMSYGTSLKIKLEVLNHRVIIMEHRKQCKIGTWTVLPFEVQHDAEEPFGFLLQNQENEKLLYITDSYYVKYRFNGLTHVMLECNYSMDILKGNKNLPSAHKKRVMKSHFSLENVKDFFRANDLSTIQEIHLLHLSAGNSDAKRFKREIEQLTGKPTYVAKQG